jgi:hypothetical protein
VKATTTLLDCNNTAIAFQGSFVDEADQFTPEDYTNMIESWICIEDEDEVVNAICEDEIEMLESNTQPPANDDAEDDNEPDVQPMELENDNIVSYVEALEMLQKLQISAPSLLGANQEARVHLDRFLKAIHTANAKKSRKDTTLQARILAKSSSVSIKFMLPIKFIVFHCDTSPFISEIGRPV